MTSESTVIESATFAFLDIETTGGNSARDRITEIGIRFWQAGEVVDAADAQPFYLLDKVATPKGQA